MSTSFMPKSYHNVTPYLMTPNAEKTIQFLKQAFGATEKGPALKSPDGSIMHAEVTIGDSTVMLGDAKGHCQPTTAALYLYVPDVDATYKRALDAGGKSTQEVTDQFYGDRTGSVTDPAGNQWWIATHKEDVMGEELQRRARDFVAKFQGEHKKAA